MQKTSSFTMQCWGLFFWISKKWKSSFLFFCQQGFELCSPKFVNLWNSSFMSQISSLMLLMMIAIMMIMITMMVMLIMITIKIMNVEHIWLISLDAMWIKISFAVACDFNQLVYAGPASTSRALWIFGLAPPRPNPPCEKKLPHPSLDFTLIDYSHSDHRRLDYTQLDYLWHLDYRRTTNTFGLFQLDLLRRLDYTPKRLQ